MRRRYRRYASRDRHTVRLTLLLGVLAMSIGFSATSARADVSFMGLGDLPAGGFGSGAHGVSGDGSVVAGYGNSASGMETAVWTSSGGMVGLGDLAGGGYGSIAYDVSADGSVVVG